MSKKYCIVVLDNTKGMMEELTELSNTPIDYLEGQNKTAFIAVFESELDPVELKQILNTGNRRSFFLFVIDSRFSAVHIDEIALQSFLFKDLDLDTFLTNKEFNLTKPSIDENYDEERLRSLTSEERNSLIDDILANPKNISDNQKKILSFLTNLQDNE